MDSLEKLASAAKTEIENAHFYLGKLEESLGRMACIVDNIRKKAEEANEVAEGGSPIPPKQTPPGVRISATGDMAAPNKVSDRTKKSTRKAWHASHSQEFIVRMLLDRSGYMIPHKCVRYRFFEVEGDKFVEFRISAEHHHSSTLFVAVEEFSVKLVDELDDQLVDFNAHISRLMTVKFQPKDDQDSGWGVL